MYELRNIFNNKFMSTESYLTLPPEAQSEPSGDTVTVFK